MVAQIQMGRKIGNFLSTTR